MMLVSRLVRTAVKLKTNIQKLQECVQMDLIFLKLIANAKAKRRFNGALLTVEERFNANYF